MAILGTNDITVLGGGLMFYYGIKVLIPFRFYLLLILLFDIIRIIRGYYYYQIEVSLKTVLIRISGNSEIVIRVFFAYVHNDSCDIIV